MKKKVFTIFLIFFFTILLSIIYSKFLKKDKLIEINQNDLSDTFVANLSASFQLCISKILLGKIKKTIKKLEDQSIKIYSLSVVGGVSNNKYIAKKIKDFFKNKKVKILFPTKDMMSDNAAMIAWNCINKNLSSSKDIYFKANPRLTIK